MAFPETLAHAFGASDATPHLYPGEQQLLVKGVNSWISGHSVTVEQRRMKPEHARALAGVALLAGSVATGLPLSLLAADGIAKTALALREVPELEGVGGLLSLTTMRLCFCSHRMNFHLGRFSIFLPTIESVDVTGSVGPALRVHTGALTYRFVAQDQEHLRDEIMAAKQALDADAVTQLRAAVRADIERAGYGLRAFFRDHADELSEERLFAAIERADQLDRLNEVYGVFNVVELLYPELVPALLAKAPIVQDL